MEHGSLAEQEGNSAIIAAATRIVAGPVQVPQEVGRKTYQAYPAIFVSWLRATWQRERERQELTTMRGRDFGDLPVPPSLVLDEARHWPWQKSSTLWATLVRRRTADGSGVPTGLFTVILLPMAAHLL